MEPTYTFEAGCTTCKAKYHVEVLSSQRKRVKAAAGNRDVWMQTHTDTTGHARFWLDESKRSYHIMAKGNNPQMLLSDDENYSTFQL